MHNTFKIRGERTQRQQDSLKNLVKFENFCIKKQHAMKLKSTTYPVIMNSIQGMAFKMQTNHL